MSGFFYKNGPCSLWKISSISGYMGAKYFQKFGLGFLILAPTNMFLLGACRHPDPPLFLGGLQPPDPLAGGLQPPVPPCIPRGSAYRALHFFGTMILVPRSWYQNLGSGSWYQVACRVPNVACHAVSIPFVSKSSVSCRVINLRVGVSVPCRGHPV